MLERSVIFRFYGLSVTPSLSQKTQIDSPFFSFNRNNCNPLKLNRNSVNSLGNAQIFLHIVVTHKIPKIQIWLVIELTYSENFFFVVCQKIMKSDGKEQTWFQRARTTLSKSSSAYNQTNIFSY